MRFPLALTMKIASHIVSASGKRIKFLTDGDDLAGIFNYHERHVICATGTVFDDARHEEGGRRYALAGINATAARANQRDHR